MSQEAHEKPGHKARAVDFGYPADVLLVIAERLDDRQHLVVRDKPPAVHHFVRIDSLPQLASLRGEFLVAVGELPPLLAGRSGSSSMAATIDKRFQGGRVGRGHTETSHLVQPETPIGGMVRRTVSILATVGHA